MTSDSLSARDFTRLADYVRAISGIKLPPGKRTMLESRLRRRVRATGADSFADYCAWLFDGDDPTEELTELVNVVTTNTTAFFREPRQFDYLQQVILPAAVAAGVTRLRAWSAACSTGAEPYTVAMLLDAFAQDAHGPQFNMIATDLDTEVLEVALRGVYPVDAVDPVPPALRARYMRRARQASRNEVRIDPRLRAQIAFAQLNLMDDAYAIGAPMDLIFCRNVLIYFERPTQYAVIRRLCDCLAPGGHLFLGHSESIAGFDLPLVTVANTVFRRS